MPLVVLPKNKLQVPLRTIKLAILIVLPAESTGKLDFALTT